jgi:5-methylthioadenosine/S-adenosylhomocysteine deaminase
MDFLLDNAFVVTVDRDFRMFSHGAVAVRDGAIVAVGDSADVRARFPDLVPEDMGGQAVLPGLINSHTHVPMSLFRGLADDRELMDWLLNYIFPAEAACLNEEFVLWGTRLSLAEMIRGGTTTIVDMYMFERVVAEECARVGMRGVLGQALIDFPTPDFPNWEAMVEGCRDFVGEFRGHALVRPAIAPHSPYSVSPEHLRQTQQLAEELDCPLIIHLAETRKEHEQVLSERGQSPVSYLEQLGLLSRRLIAAHVVWPDDPEIALLAQRGVGVGHCPQSNAKLASGIAPVVKMLQAGVRVGLGTDGCASNNDLDMWQEMQTANFLQKLSQDSPTVMTARETLQLATIGGARAAHIEDVTGSIEVGKRADLIVVRLDGLHQMPVYDPVSQLAYTTKSSDVRRVYIDGKLVMADGVVFSIDAAELREAVVAQSARVRSILKKTKGA